jgi:hypothetical protein
MFIHSIPQNFIHGTNQKTAVVYKSMNKEQETTSDYLLNSLFHEETHSKLIFSTCQLNPGLVNNSSHLLKL